MTDSVETDAPDYKYANGKPATALQRRFAEWLQSDEVGYNPATAKSKADAFAEGVRYAVALRIPYQASDHNRQATAVERAERQEARVAAAAEREEARAARAASKEETAEEPKPKPKPVKAAAARKGKAAAPAPTPAAAPAPTRRPAARRAPARAAAPAADAPF